MKKIIIAVISLIFVTSVNAQQIPVYSQYMLNMYAVNPAVAGTTPYTPITMTYRQAWTGIDDAPTLKTLSSHLPVSEKVGIGAKIFNYSAGPINRLGIEATYSYSLPVGASGDRLSMGISGLLYQYHLNKSNLVLENSDDNAINYGSERLIVPDASFGAYYHGDNYNAGLAITNLFNRKIDLMNENVLEQRQVRHYFLHAGYNYVIDEKFAVEPSFLMKFIEAGVMQLDINAKVVYKQMLWAGLSYRTKDAMAIILGVTKKRFQFGYSYDLTFNDIGRYSNGSHELIFTYKLSSSKPKL